jgi:hypothetical protein
MKTTYTRGYRAHTTAGAVVRLPDQIAVDQASYDGQSIPVRTMDGVDATAILRGDLYGLGTPGTGDPIVELND